METATNNQDADERRSETNNTDTAAGCSSTSVDASAVGNTANRPTTSALRQMEDDAEDNYPSSVHSDASPPGTVRGSFIHVANRSDSDIDNAASYRPDSTPQPASGIDERNRNSFASHSPGADSSCGPSGLQPLNPSSESSASDYECSPPRKDFFVDVKTMHESNPNRLYGIRVLSSLVDGGSGGLPTTFNELQEELQRNHSPEEQEKLYKLVRKKILDLASRKQLPALASFLKIKQYECLVLSSLESILLDLQNSQDSSVTGNLLEVAKEVQSVFLQQYEESPVLLPMALLHVMSVSAVLSRCVPPSQEQCTALFISKKQMKKLNCEGLKQLAVKGVQAFHEGLEGVLDKVSSFQQWSQTGFSDEERVKRRSDFTRASFCELIVHIFTILNEVKNSALNEHAQSLLTTLIDLYKTTVNSRKQKLADEPRALLDFCLVRGSVMLLQSTFDGEQSQVGQHRCEHVQLITSLILLVISAAHLSFKRCLLREIECLAFHKSAHVRKTFNKLFSDEKQPLLLLAQGYMMNDLQDIRFHRHLKSTEQLSDSDKSRKSCEWSGFTCTVAGKQADVRMYTPTASCMAKAQLETCSSQHPGSQESNPKARAEISEEARRHMRNLDTLKELSTKCKHLLTLYSYQLLPFPFYVTEEIQQRRLLLWVLDHRNAKEWLGDIDIVRIMHQVVDALMFLCEHNTDPRDITAYNMIVQPGADSNNRQSLRERCSVLTSPGFVVKLADLGLSHEFRDNDNKIRRVRSQGQVPLRWISPEALFEGKYGEKNMTYALACVMYELCTHGCQPFSSYDQTMNTEELIQRKYTDPEDIRLGRRPCIPSDFHNLMTKCTHHSPEKRPSLREFKNELCQLSSARRQQNSVREPGVETALSLEKKYGNISPDQIKRHHVPESGIPESIEELIDAGKNSSLYNAYRASIRTFNSKTVVTDQELQAQDWMRIEHQENCTIVEEIVSQKFVSEKLPSLEASNIVDLGRTDECLPKLTRLDNGQFVYKREYPPGQTLKEAVFNNLLRNTEQDVDHYDEVSLHEASLWYLTPLLSLAERLEAMHEKGWIHRDLKEDNILIDCSDGQVKFLRTGRMDRLKSPETFLVDDVFDDSQRWLAPEVLLSGQHSKEGDMFMWGGVVGQLFHIDDIVNKNPQATDRDLAPYPNIEKDKVVDHIRGPAREELPPGLCPVWLHELSRKCRDPDPACRPTAKDVVDCLRGHYPQEPVPTPFLSFPVDRGGDMAITSETAGGTEVVEMRKKSKPQRTTLVLQPGKMKQRNLWKSVKDRLKGKRGGTTKKRVTVCGSIPRGTEIFDSEQSPQFLERASPRSVRRVTKRANKASNFYQNLAFVDPDETCLKTILQSRPADARHLSLHVMHPDETLLKTVAQDSPVENGQRKSMGVGGNYNNLCTEHLAHPDETSVGNAAHENDKEVDNFWGSEFDDLSETSAKITTCDRGNVRDAAWNSAAENLIEPTDDDDEYAQIENSPEGSPDNDFKIKDDVVSSTVRLAPSDCVEEHKNSSQETHPQVTDCMNSGKKRSVSSNEDQKTCSGRNSTSLETVDVKPAIKSNVSVTENRRKRPKRRQKRKCRNFRGSNDSNAKRVKGGAERSGKEGSHLTSMVAENQTSDDDCSDSALKSNGRHFYFVSNPCSTGSALHRLDNHVSRPHRLWMNRGSFPGDDESPKHVVSDYRNMNNQLDNFRATSRSLLPELSGPDCQNMKDPSESSHCIRTDLSPEMSVLEYRNQLEIFSDTSRGLSPENFVPHHSNTRDPLDSFIENSEGPRCTQEMPETERIHSQTPASPDNPSLPCPFPEENEGVYEASGSREDIHEYEGFERVYNDASSTIQPVLRSVLDQFSPSSAELFSEEQAVAVQLADPEEDESSVDLETGPVSLAASTFPLFPSEMQSCLNPLDARSAGRISLGHPLRHVSSVHLRPSHHLTDAQTIGRRLTFTVCPTGQNSSSF